jgi:hypothetical protein
MKPTSVGWWWLWSVDARAVDGWLPTWVRVVSGRLAFWDERWECFTPVDSYQWGGPVVRVAAPAPAPAPVQTGGEP